MLSIIVATSPSGVMGVNGKLPWHIPSDLKRFKAITEGHPIIMGRKTFASLPNVLPNREHLIITRQDEKFTMLEGTMVSFINDWKLLANIAKQNSDETFVIGGAEIYKLLMPYVDKMYITVVAENVVGDTFFPKYNVDEWDISLDGDNHSTAINDLEPFCSYYVLTRKDKGC